MPTEYYDFQLSKARGKFGDKVLTLKLLFGNVCVTHHKSPPNHGTAKFDKLLLETEPW